MKAKHVWCSDVADPYIPVRSLNILLVLMCLYFQSSFRNVLARILTISSLLSSLQHRRDYSFSSHAQEWIKVKSLNSFVQLLFWWSCIFLLLKHMFIIVGVLFILSSDSFHSRHYCQMWLNIFSCMINSSLVVMWNLVSWLGPNCVFPC